MVVRRAAGGARWRCEEGVHRCIELDVCHRAHDGLMSICSCMASRHSTLLYSMHEGNALHLGRH